MAADAPASTQTTIWSARLSPIRTAPSASPGRSSSPFSTEEHAAPTSCEANTNLKQRREELANIQGQIDQEVRAALLDLKSAADQVAVAQDNVGLASETLTQARDRFAAGVTDNIEVVQAQDSVASAQQNLISAMYAHNLAKVALARAMGATEANLKAFMGGK